MKIKSIYKNKELNDVLDNNKDVLKWLLNEQKKRLVYLSYSTHRKTQERLLRQMNEIALLMSYARPY